MRTLVCFFVLCTLSSSAKAQTSTGSRFVDVDTASLPSALRNTVARAIRYVDSVLVDDRILGIIAAKNDWTFAGTTSGDSIARAIRNARDIETGAPVGARLRFYRSPRTGRDECGGVSAPGLPTSSTGCTDRHGVIHRNVRFQDAKVAKTSQFLVHEWLHAAGFGHGGNAGQCKKDKRNSVPIWVSCVATSDGSQSAVSACGQPC